MKNQIRIRDGKLGCFLTIGNKAVKKDFLGNITLNTIDYQPNNWIATEFVNVKAIREFWGKYRVIILSIYNNLNNQ